MNWITNAVHLDFLMLSAKANFVCFTGYMVHPFSLFFLLSFGRFSAHHLFVEHSEILDLKGCGVIKEK